MAKGQSIADRLLTRLKKDGLVHEIAAQGMPSDSSLRDAVETTYYVAERCVMFSRTLAAPHYQWNAPSASVASRPAFLLRCALRDVGSYAAARSFVLLMLQDSAEVRSHLTDSSLRAELRIALGEIGRLDRSPGVQHQVGLHLTALG
jgi:hypothetical protein